jgi:hypothetical protein
MGTLLFLAQPHIVIGTLLLIGVTMLVRWANRDDEY